MTPNTEKQARIAEDRAERELSQYMAAHMRSSLMAQRRAIQPIFEGRGMPTERGMGVKLKVEAQNSIILGVENGDFGVTQIQPMSEYYCSLSLEEIRKIYAE